MREQLRGWLLPSVRTSLDVDLRYGPVLRFLRRQGKKQPLLEIGSGSVGIAAYLQDPVVSVDTRFDGELPENLLAVIARGALPFRDRSFPVVITLDTLEHVPPPERGTFLSELMRVTDRHLIAGFPVGRGARDHDASLDRYYLRQHGERHPFLREHAEHGVPTVEEARNAITETAAGTGRTFSLGSVENVNLGLRAGFMRLVWNRRRHVQRLYTILSVLGRWDPLFSFGQCYRLIWFVTFGEAHGEG